ncbi:hypothetical protein [Formosa algae]|uniref:Uncharacterized protein n=1 Tax=Formosa algae TaxID=225843 RepID=A0A9X0YLB6_9FLAO|nr:hypothetical protein [Formosa algae]MBP1840714.1 hypothetical protein [Formosa algae]MDQ0335873.1 hypothetical protein [Formosa algae]OEI81226.1 hypothetical protein AST99_06090 [Formosa algae]
MINIQAFILGFWLCIVNVTAQNTNSPSTDISALFLSIFKSLTIKISNNLEYESYLLDFNLKRNALSKDLYHKKRLELKSTTLESINFKEQNGATYLYSETKINSDTSEEKPKIITSSFSAFFTEISYLKGNSGYQITGNQTSENIKTNPKFCEVYIAKIECNALPYLEYYIS